MPTYDYACTECGHRFDIVQAFTDDSLTECPECGGRLRKVFGAVGVVFKGSGFYRNDSRSSSHATSGGSGSHGSSSSTSNGSSDTSGEKAGATSDKGSGSATSSKSSDGAKSSTSTAKAGSAA